eukprot:TRINITY_DN8480_c0_g3_i2.p1 TRINITY_DN8480_c0_g3~~TRINITY_DN8480_c0_g3_i2.p1  ORF type:complete len:252 (+),score=29.83 TRINITY_DN8480_c0_g3_i2:224-979(+)
MQAMISRMPRRRPHGNDGEGRWTWKKGKKNSFMRGDQSGNLEMADVDYDFGEFGKGIGKRLGKGKSGMNDECCKSKKDFALMGGCRTCGGDSNETVSARQGCVIGQGDCDFKREGSLSGTCRFEREKLVDFGEQHDAEDFGRRTCRGAKLHHSRVPGGSTRIGHLDDGLEREDDENTDLLSREKHYGNVSNTRTPCPTLLHTFGWQSDAAPMHRNSRRASITRPSRSRPSAPPSKKDCTFDVTKLSLNACV